MKRTGMQIRFFMFSILVIMIGLLACASCGSSASDAKKGDIITFGAYEQDGDTSNGKEPIEWEVLDVEADSVLVISRYVLDCVPYNKKHTDVTWETCTLRNWLNTDFYNTAFSAEEQKQVAESSLSNPDNEYYGTPGGNDTQDKVFLLSVEELYRYYDFNALHDDEGFRASEALITEATPYAADSYLWTHEITREDYNNYLKAVGYSEACIGKTGVLWWLRSPGRKTGLACYVFYDGSAGWCYYCGGVGTDSVGVRPALRLGR